jgi:hypothetical protein
MSISNNPQYSNIKNDYTVWGAVKNASSDAVKPIRYHVAFDQKPTLTDDYRFGMIYTNYLGLEQFAPLQLEGDEKNLFSLNKVQQIDPQCYYTKRCWTEDIKDDF